MKNKFLSLTRSNAFLPVGLLVIGLLLTVFTLQQSQDKRIRAAGENSVIITGIASDNSSAKISFQQIPGAADYRIYDISNPKLVKYAGQRHSGGQADPSTQIEWNLLGDGQVHTLVVEALDRLGPIPRGNQYNDTNQPVVNPVPNSSMLGANAGGTPDGNFSINGQGESANAPNVIARSQPFEAHASSSTISLPSGSDATQVFFDSFPNSEAQNISKGESDATQGSINYTLTTNQTVWDVLFRGVDTNNSMPFIADSHFMDMVFDGGTPGTSTPLHSSFGLMSMTPRPTIDFSNRQIAHLTMEIDSHFSQNRWGGFEISPANDPLINWNPQNRINSLNRGVFVEIADNCTVDFYTRSKSPADPAPLQNRLIGSESSIACNRARNGKALDNRSRFDVFVSSNHIALFEDGALLVQGDIPNGWLDFQQAHAYFTHYNTQSAASRQTLRQKSADEDFWISKFPFSDERHWDNMGFEVLPSSAASASDWRLLSERIHMPINEQPAISITPTISTSPTNNPSPTLMPSMPHVSITPTFTITPTPVVSGGNGLTGRYILIPTRGRSNTTLNRIDPVINFDTNTPIPEGTFRAIWNGFITVSQSGRYAFFVPTDGFARLFVNNKVMAIGASPISFKIFGELPSGKNIERWIKKRNEIFGTMQLDAGKKYKIQLDYLKLSGKGNLQLQWSSPTILKQIIPQTQLSSQ